MNAFLPITDPNHVLRAGIDQCRIKGHTDWEWVVNDGYHGWKIEDAIKSTPGQEFRCIEEMHPTRMRLSGENEEFVKIARDDRSNVEADRRFQLIKEAMSALITRWTLPLNPKEIAEAAVGIADAVIKRMQQL